MADQIATRRLLALQYFANVPPRDCTFRWPSSSALLAIRDYIFNDIFFRNQCEALEEKPSSYRRNFVKELLARLEKAVSESGDADLEIDECLLRHYAELLTRCSMDSGVNERRRYFYPTKPCKDQSTGSDEVQDIFRGWDCTIIREDASTIARGTTGLKTWEASLRLAAHLSFGNNDILEKDGLHILELGSGCGFLGITLAKQAPQCHFCLTDMDGVALHQLQHTVGENLGSDSNVTVQALDWIDALDDSSATAAFLTRVRPHVILGADIIYDPELIEPLCKVIKVLLSGNNCLSTPTAIQAPYALIASTVRNEQTFALFLQTLDHMSLMAEEVELRQPYIDLQRGCLVEESFDGTKMKLFTSSHDPHRDGHVHLLRLSLQESSNQST